MKKCTGKCKIITKQDFIDNHVAICTNHAQHQGLFGISKYRKVAVRMLHETVRTINKHPEVCC